MNAIASRTFLVCHGAWSAGWAWKKVHPLMQAAGHRLVVRNGHKDEREIQTGIVPIAVRQPRVNDKRVDEHGRRMQFTSKMCKAGTSPGRSALATRWHQATATSTACKERGRRLNSCPDCTQRADRRF